MDGIHCDIHHKTVDVITYPYPNLSQSHLVKEAPGHFFAPVLHKHFYKEVLYLMTQLEHCLKLFMPPPLGAGGIMFSGCPSVRPSEAWNNLFSPVHGSVGPSDQPWPFCGMSVCPSVRPERFPDICRRTHGGNGLKFCMLMYLGHLQNWLDYGHGVLIFLLLASLWLSEMGQIWGFRAFPGERIVGMAWNFACWCILTTFRTE